MSFLVAMARAHYHDNAFDAFTALSGYSLENARAMMWMSQLAYDTDDRPKVESVLDAWGLGLRAFVTNNPITGFPLGSACVVVAGGRGATIVSFAGTDPLKVSDWHTDFSALPSPDGLHRGFANSLDSAWSPIEGAIAARPNTEQALFFTGHSLGGALALIAAERAASDPAVKARATGVYVFGCPRAGGDAFFNTYTLLFGDSTFRLVHGSDIVATVPPAGLFRHVGRLIQCDSGRLFTSQTPMSDHDNDNPEMAESVEAALKADARDIVETGVINPPIGTRPVAQAARDLLRIFRDHVPDNYFRALSVTIG